MEEEEAVTTTEADEGVTITTVVDEVDEAEAVTTITGEVTTRAVADMVTRVKDTATREVDMVTRAVMVDTVTRVKDTVTRVARDTEIRVTRETTKVDDIR